MGRCDVDDVDDDDVDDAGEVATPNGPSELAPDAAVLALMSIGSADESELTDSRRSILGWIEWE